MMDLFSPFNPISSINYNFNWIMMSIPFIMITISPYWWMYSPPQYPLKMITMYIINQFKSSMKLTDTPNLLMVWTIFMIIMLFNLTSLLPNTFPVSSHISINLSIALPMWIGLMMKKMKKMKSIMSHLTPMNTPMMLTPFMVLIELISLLIQPMTLTIRLTANITAGHIMMILISQMYQIYTMPTLIVNITIMILELMVSAIQAYVFSMLITMYMK